MARYGGAHPCDCSTCEAARDQRRKISLLMLIVGLIGFAALIASRVG